MRYNVILSLENTNIPKDKNRIILSFLKHIYQSYDQGYYESLFENEENKVKDYTFSLYMPNCKFTREEIIVPEKKMIFNFSTSNMLDGIMFYNSVNANIRKPYKIKENTLTPTSINMTREKLITRDFAIFKTMSPIVLREHRGDNKKTWYYSFSESKGRDIFLENLKYQLLREFGEERSLDIEEVEFEIAEERLKTVKVKNYGIEILSNIGLIKLYAKPYILDYIYKAGVGSKRSTGFGMLDLV